MNKVDLMAALAKLLHEVCAGKVVRKEVVERLRAMADGLDAPEQLPLDGGSKPQGKNAKRNSVADSITEVFNYWRERTGHEKARLLPERARLIRSRLRSFTVADLKLAIDGCTLSDFHAGGNEGGERYDWPENIFRNGPAVERHIERAREAGTHEEQSPQDAKANSLRREIAKAQEAGNIERANELNERLRRLLSSASA